MSLKDFKISFKNITDDIKVKCINFTYGNDVQNNFNFITLFYSANIKDENMTMDNFLYFSYGLTLESADGEVKLGAYNKSYFYYIFNYNNPSPNLFNFLVLGLGVLPIIIFLVMLVFSTS